MENNTWELLAPAGSLESLYAALENGADAVYLGAKKFGARAQAANFDEEEIRKAVRACHLRGVKIFVTVNTLYKEDEIREVFDLTDDLYQMGVDAIIVQDVGLAELASKRYPDMEVHASTQMFIHNLEGAFAMRDLGLERVVVAREMSLAEISRIRDQVGIDIEGFIHGALCVSYSGQCLMSSMIGGRSGNRGRCAQPCRKSYEIFSLKEGQARGASKYYLSPRDLNSLDTIKDWIRAGVYSLKIEGRMKRPEYVATIVGAYRKALEEELSPQDYEEVEQIFNRKFTKGLAFKDFGKTYISGDKPNNRGVKIGRVLDTNPRESRVLFNKKLDPGDGISLLDYRGETLGFTVQESMDKGEASLPLGNLKQDSAVYRSSWNQLLRKAKASYQESRPRYGLKGSLYLVMGEKPRLVIHTPDGDLPFEGNQLVEEAKRAPLDESRVREQMDKLGGTLFYWEELAISMKGDVFYPVSELNALRRQAIEALERGLVHRERRGGLGGVPSLPKGPGPREKTKLRLVLEDPLKLEGFHEYSQVERLYLDFTEDLNLDWILDLVDGRLDLFIVLPRVMESPEMDRVFDKIEKYKGRIGLSVQDLGSLRRAKALGFTKIHGEAGLYAMNSLAINTLGKMGMKTFTTSYELNLAELRTLGKNYGSQGEVLVHGLVPVMTMKNCPAAFLKGCEDDSQCTTCAYCTGMALVDERGEKFAFKRRQGFTELFNSHPLFAPDLVSVLAEEWSGMRLRIGDEDPNEVVGIYGRALRGESARREEQVLRDKMIKVYGGITKGHLRRGVQ